jgi:putative glycosyltransferase (TIGR04372 family)
MRYKYGHLILPLGMSSKKHFDTRGAKNKKYFSLSYEQRNDCKKILEDHGFMGNQGLVSIVVRDAAYTVENLVQDSISKNDRNADIKDYEKAIQYFLDKGFTVFRMGSVVQSKVVIQNDNFLDYPFSKIRSELMDLYLISESKIIFGTPSGIMEVWSLGEEPYICFTDVVDLHNLVAQKSKTIINLASLRDEKGNNITDVRRIYDYTFLREFAPALALSLNYKWVKASSEELLTSAQEVVQHYFNEIRESEYSTKTKEVINAHIDKNVTNISGGKYFSIFSNVTKVGLDK